MIKSALLATAICFAFVVPSYSQSAVKCDEASLTKLRSDIDAMTDKDAQAKSVKSWEEANTAFKANNMEVCNERMTDTGKSLQGQGQGGEPATTTQ
jgi:hypothetical protein